MPSTKYISNGRYFYSTPNLGTRRHSRPSAAPRGSEVTGIIHAHAMINSESSVPNTQDRNLAIKNNKNNISTFILTSGHDDAYRYSGNLALLTAECILWTYKRDTDRFFEIILN